jgi:hypothetical protein
VLLRLARHRKEIEASGGTLVHRFIHIQYNKSPTHQLH